jgi:hypothetical protein
LEEVYFEGNPVQKREPVLYRNKLRLALPQVAKIDACEFFFFSFGFSCFLSWIFYHLLPSFLFMDMEMWDQSLANYCGDSVRQSHLNRTGELEDQLGNDERLA